MGTELRIARTNTIAIAYSAYDWGRPGETAHSALCSILGDGGRGSGEFSRGQGGCRLSENAGEDMEEERERE